MFTFGIFTTHLPYAALVLFYLFVIIGGFTRKPSGSEFSPDEMQQSKVVVVCCQATSFEVTVTPTPEKEGHAPFSEFTSAGQHYFPDKPDKIIISEEFYIGRSICSALFCRPPPSV